MLIKCRGVARRRIDFRRVRMRLRSRCRNIRRASLPELRQRLSRQQRRNVSFGRSRFAGMLLRRPRRCILRRRKFAPKTPTAISARPAPAAATPASATTTTAPDKTPTAIPARPSAARTILKSPAISTRPSATRWTRNCWRKRARSRRDAHRLNGFTRKRFEPRASTGSCKRTRSRARLSGRMR